jgi:hypothetical protein
MTWRHVDQALPAYALDLLAGDETAVIEQHLATCTRCRDKAAAYQEAASALFLAQTPPADSPPVPELFDRILAETRRTPQARPAAPASVPAVDARQRHTRRPFMWPALAVAATVVLILALGGLASMRTIAAQRAQLRQQASQLATAEAALAIMAGDQVQRTPLRPAANAPAAASGQVYTTADDRAIVIALANVPAPPAGQEYQTTVQIDGATLATGVLRLDATGQGFVVARLPGSSEVQRVWITLAPSGAAPGTPAAPLWQADIAP